MKRIPVVAGHNLDLHRLFIEVTTRGGVEQVIKNRKCKAVIQSLNVSTTTTNAAYLLKKYYLDILFAFEHVYFFQEPLSSFRSREEAMNRFLIEKKSANHDNDNDNGTHELEAGCLINGIIDGKFEDGYFVTMKMGSQELKGVLYHTPETSADARRRKKKAKSPSEMDFARPKSHRSGYNFFVADQYQRIKHEYAGQDRYPIKEIGNKWSNLPASDRKVYLDKGSEDAERYKTEMSEYYALVQSCAADIVAKIDDAASANDDAAAANDDAAAAHDDAAAANDEAEL
ncbi:unnamed protein product [Thlaspi arvense]|uniref:HMG box domain-containing protein n=1 Tax=Thlaspi arvense TaxID=13288 RepID=A0AAU9R3R3_THLAR|nr:unnamed protein product [Thlaspi arvense]